MSGRLVEPIFLWWLDDSIQRIVIWVPFHNLPSFISWPLAHVSSIAVVWFNMYCLQQKHSKCIYLSQDETPSCGERTDIRQNNCSSNLSSSHMYDLWVIKWQCSKAIVNLVICGRMCITVTIWKIYHPCDKPSNYELSWNKTKIHTQTSKDNASPNLTAATTLAMVIKWLVAEVVGHKINTDLYVYKASYEQYS